MELLPEKLRDKRFVYSSDKPADELRAEMDIQLESARSWNVMARVLGSFTSFNEFNIRPKWQGLLTYVGFNTSLHGVLLQDAAKRTLVAFKVRVGNGYAVLFFVLLLFGVEAIYEMLSAKKFDPFGIIGLAIAGGIAYLPLLSADYNRKELLRKFVKEFDLKPTNFPYPEEQ